MIQAHIQRRRDVLRAIADCTAIPKRLKDVYPTRPVTTFDVAAVSWLAEQGYLGRVRVGAVLEGLEVTPKGLAWLEAGGPAPQEWRGCETRQGAAVASVAKTAGGGERVVKKPDGM